MSDMSTNLRISDLATELGEEDVDLMSICDDLGIRYRSSATRVTDTQASKIRQRVERNASQLGLSQKPDSSKLANKDINSTSIRPTEKVEIGARLELIGDSGKPTIMKGGGVQSPDDPGDEPVPFKPVRRTRTRTAVEPRIILPPPPLPSIKPVLQCTLDGDRTSVFSQSSALDPELKVTGRPSNFEVFIHEDFFNWLSESESDARLVKRARYVLTELLRQGFARGTKGVKGVAAGWLRAPLGGSPNGFHYYLWYVAGSSAVGRNAGLSNDQILVKTVRHHDETDEPIYTGTPEKWIELRPNDVVSDQDDSPFTAEQMRIAFPSSSTVRTVRGYPGSGKTTALLLSALTSGTDRVLYLTFNHRLVNEARGFLDTFLADPELADVMSFESLLEEMADARPGSIQIARSHECARALMEKLEPHVARGFGVWGGQAGELYDELHAHAFGRSLPFEFRGLNASSGAHLSPDQYLATRLAEGLGDAARDAAEILRQVASKDLAGLFPGPFCARSLLNNVDAPPPPRFSNVGLILVDEVQDLTPIEALLVLNLVARIGVESGRLPQLMFAGDESQTVRPTEFEWAWLRDLVRAVLPNATFEDFSLDVNLRSPKLLAEVVEATKNQYRYLGKSDRPAGQMRTLADDSAEGRVIYATCASDDYFENLLDLAEQTPRCALIYPDSSLPDGISSIDDESVALSAAEAKGLDFETVVLVDAGERLKQMLQLLAVSKTEPKAKVRARSMADQFRVAVSRSTYNLVLVDREENLDAVEQAMDRPWTMPFERIEFADLHDELVGDVDDEQIVRSVVSEVEDLLLVNVQRALLRSRSASRRLDRLMNLQQVPSSLSMSVDRIRGLSAALALTDSTFLISSADRRALEVEARNHLDLAGLLKPLSAYMAMVALEANEVGSAVWDESVLKTIDEGASTRAQLAEAAPQVLDRLDRMLVRWVRSALEGPVNQIDKFEILASSTRDVVDQLGAAHQYLSKMVDSSCNRWALLCVEAGQPESGLKVLASQRDCDLFVRAMCNEAASRWAEAFDDFVGAGKEEDAVRCARKGGDYKAAQQLHGNQDDNVGRSLRFVEGLNSFVEGADEVELLPEEILQIKSNIDRLFAKETSKADSQ